MRISLIKKILSRFFLSAPQFSIDSYDRSLVSGWARIPARPGKHCFVELKENGTTVASSIANIYRDDLLQAGLGDGCYGFQLFTKMGPLDVRPREFHVFINGKQVTSLPIVITPNIDQSVLHIATELETRMEALLALHSERITRELDKQR